MSEGRNHAGLIALQGKLYIIGGYRRAGTEPLATVQIFDLASGAWTEGAPKGVWEFVEPMPTGRSGIAAAALGSDLIVFGGETFGAVTKTFNEAEAFDPRINTWRELPRMPTARHGLGAATISNRVHVLSGGPTAGLSYSAVNEYLERR